MSQQKELLVLIKIRVVMVGVNVMMNSVDTVKAVEDGDGAIIAASIGKFDDGVVFCKLSKLNFTDAYAFV